MFTVGPAFWTVAETDPFADQTILLMKFNDDLVDEKGNAFLADGTMSYIDDWLGGRAVSIGGATSGLGGANVIYMVTPNAAFSMQGDITVEVAGRINSNVARPRTLIRIADGADADIAYLAADLSGVPTFKAGARSGAGSTAQIQGSAVGYGDDFHFAVCRNGSTLKAWFNGVQVGTTETSSYVPTFAGCTVYIGNSRRSFIDALDGDIAWARVTNACRYTDTFTPPAEPA
jgi:hypothetical protein